VTEPVLVATTCTVNAASVLVALPSETLIVIVALEPTSPCPGVPETLPVDVLNVAHAGRPVTLNDSVSPSASEAVGVNEYCVPATTDVAGAPDMEGPRLVPATGGLLGELSTGAAAAAASSSPPSPPHALSNAVAAKSAETNKGVRSRECEPNDAIPGNPAILGEAFRPVALRLRLSADLPFAWNGCDCA
jgi:hypothetical protein